MTEAGRPSRAPRRPEDPMTDAFIYDACRTPRGKGRPDGALHEVTSVALSRRHPERLKNRNGMTGHAVEDVIWGNVTQVGEQGGCLPAARCWLSDLDERIPGLAINRFCASGMEAVNLAANQSRAGRHAYIAGGVEMMGRVAMAATGPPSRWTDAAMKPTSCRRHFRRHHRHRIRLHPRTGRCAGRRIAAPRRRGLGRQPLARSIVPVTDPQRPDHP